MSTERPTADDAAVRTTQLTRRFGDQTVVDAIDLEVRTGEIFGLLGPNGSGKSTTLRLLTGLIRPSSGEIDVLGSAPGTTPQRIGAVIEEPAVYPYLTGRRNLALWARLVGAPSASVDRHLELLGLADAADRPAGGYSTGMRQRLGIAAALVHGRSTSCTNDAATSCAHASARPERPSRHSSRRRSRPARGPTTNSASLRQLIARWRSFGHWSPPMSTSSRSASAAGRWKRRTSR